MSVENGHKRVHRPIGERDVLIEDRHEGYISWEEFERNQQVIADTAVSKGSAIAKGDMSLAGLLSCAHCGRKLHVHCRSNMALYLLRRACDHGGKRCVSIGSLKINPAVKRSRDEKPIRLN